MVRSNTIFTNVALTPAREPWWEGLTPRPPRRPGGLAGPAVDPGSGPAAHPNSRFTVPVQQCPSHPPNWEDPQGVPISGLIFGSRRSQVIPLVFEAFDWNHGVFLGSAMGTETTAAITGKVGVVRRDPMAMLPFCGYNMADYFAHWLSMRPRLTHPPKLFRVNWFRRDADGKFLWPGYGENVRVLKWMVERIRGGGQADETPIGYVPAPGALDAAGLSLAPARWRRRCTWTARSGGRRSMSCGEFYEQFGERMPRRDLEGARRDGAPLRALSLTRASGMRREGVRRAVAVLAWWGRDSPGARARRAPTRPSRLRSLPPRRSTSRSPSPGSSRWTCTSPPGGKAT